MNTIRITEAVKHIIIINVIFFIATYFILDKNLVVSVLSLHAVQSPLFEPWQLLSYMFMHAEGFAHIGFNMFSLWMFGSHLESRWGAKKFAIFYLLTGIGSAAVYVLIKYFQTQAGIDNASPENLKTVMTQGVEAVVNGKNFVDPVLGKLNVLINGQMLGASGAIAGLLMAFGIMYPNMKLMLLFLPFPIKAKYFIPLLIIFELTMEFAGFSWDNVAHLGHLAGMLIGYILMKTWAKKEHSEQF